MVPEIQGKQSELLRKHLKQKSNEHDIGYERGSFFISALNANLEKLLWSVQLTLSADTSNDIKTKPELVIGECHVTLFLHGYKFSVSKQ